MKNQLLISINAISKVIIFYIRTMNLSELQEYFKSKELPTGPFKLNESTTINDLPHFLNSHFSPLLIDPYSKVNQPLLSRLIELKQVLDSLKVY